MQGPERIVERLRSLPRDRGVSEDYIQLRIDLCEAQAATLRKAPEVIGPAGQSDSTLTPESLPWQGRLGLELFDSLLDACERHGRVDVEQLRGRIRDSSDKAQPDRLERLVRRVAMDNQPAYLVAESKRLAAPSDLLLFLARLTAAPFATYAVQPWTEGDVGSDKFGAESDPPHGFCPACGATPGLASLQAERASRRLHCSLCGWSWPFGRLACPFCEGSGPAGLNRLSIDESPRVWIEACGVCLHYLKTVDRRSSADASDFVPLAEEVAALALDELAQRQGYAAKPPYAAIG